MKLRTVLLCLLIVVTLKVSAENADNTYGIITGSAVNLRINPEKSAVILKTINRNQIVEIIELHDSWYRVKVDEQEGWVFKEYVSTDPEELKFRNELYLKAAEITEYARGYLGTKYFYGGNSPAGFDCSGFTMYVYDKFGYKLPHNAAAQIYLGEKINREELIGGDLVFFAVKTNGRINHVGIYLGDGEFIHASSKQGRIKINSLDDNYYKLRYRGGRRILSITGIS